MHTVFGDMRPEFVSAGINIIDLGLSRPGSGRAKSIFRSAQTGCAIMQSAKTLAQYIAAEKIDLIDAHLENCVLTAMGGSRLANKPAAVTLYAIEPNEQKFFMRPLHRLALRQAAVIITDSNERVRDIERYIGKKAPPIEVIPNGVRLNPPVRSRKDMLDMLSLPQDSKMIVGQVSGLVPFKGHQTLLSAAKLVLRRRADVRFLFAGFPRAGSSYVASLEEHARMLGIAEAVRICSYRGNIADIWNIIDVHVHASEFDSLPNAIIEGMSLGKPAVVTRVGGVPDLVKHDRTGLVVQPGDAEALAAAILRLLEDPFSPKPSASVLSDNILNAALLKVWSVKSKDDFWRCIVDILWRLRECHRPSVPSLNSVQPMADVFPRRPAKLRQPANLIESVVLQVSNADQFIAKRLSGVLMLPNRKRLSMN